MRLEETFRLLNMLKDLNNDTHIIILPAHNIHVLVFLCLII